jgi:hypothetical protein
MEELYQYEAALTMKMLWQGLLNLTTGTGRRTQLEGSIYNAREPSRNSGVVQGMAHFVMGELHFSSSYESAAERSIRLGDRFEKHSPSYFLGMQETFHRYEDLLYFLLRMERTHHHELSQRSGTLCNDSKDQEAEVQEKSSHDP